MSRLTGAIASGGSVAPMGGPVANGRAGQWAQVREASILFGYESNLDQSPRLSELEITTGGDLITRPLEQPLKPRPGAAAVVDAAWQIAYGPSVGTVIQAGVQSTGRIAPGESGTDWHNLQLAFGASRRFGDWRTQAQTAFNWYGGPLGEPYRLHRLGFSVDTSAHGCTYRLGFDIEKRAQSQTPLNNSHARGGQFNLMCAMPWSRDWLVGAALRHSENRPDDIGRPGGLQRQHTLGLRLQGALSDVWTLDTSLRFSISKDAEGYSDLLNNNARRVLRPVQLSVDLSSSPRMEWLYGAETLWQFIALQQRSNLALFRYASIGLFGGLRWKW